MAPTDRRATRTPEKNQDSHNHKLKSDMQAGGRTKTARKPPRDMQAGGGTESARKPPREHATTQAGRAKCTKGKAEMAAAHITRTHLWPPAPNARGPRGTPAKNDKKTNTGRTGLHRLLPAGPGKKRPPTTKGKARELGDSEPRQETKDRRGQKGRTLENKPLTT